MDVVKSCFTYQCKTVSAELSLGAKDGENSSNGLILRCLVCFMTKGYNVISKQSTQNNLQT